MIILIIERKNCIYPPLPLTTPPSHRLNNVVNEKMPFRKILTSSFRFMFANFFLNAFSFVNNCFQMVNVKPLFLELYIYKI